ncbi:MAG TPA: 2,3,4,5-tetrahydropyridine-2,6-dicarboxylate N-succinyltransferase [Turneriella sp.]|nr:2,3,4,5-tetrahydropyridine-2,6-dicarboxylate N-succinyltransferase [Turneriella sp.]HMY10384.1 2,3,4,5-tetrahydropyridine-2,6-dicarboxylate N-succinyltransferase [Turneriella sp.]HNL09482.1 2,3,4,5-tetrahydropyridine-2,6-dicarboxylate N-succinyltransferase [Turneriella sp.]HNL53271.1 2,3,4,5-tetrahydropyridine-2,6-dicarboxylate N-succinyltransferase [Turneriella sp.]HNM99560.1 2,3,4,5-tetrahydropyridine-2,6-dicarboxylate N-succinyltransferase [Turneriella sp.]
MEKAKLPEFIETKYEEKNNNPAVLEDTEVRRAVVTVIDMLDRGELRVATPPQTGDNQTDQWRVNAWVKKAILMYFPIQGMQTSHAGDIEYWDKIPTKKNYAAQKVRVVPPAVARYGSFLEPGAIMMPSYVNIGAYVGSGTMVDTWATVGSCAQIGQNVHLSGGVGIGGVLEPPQGLPVIVEDHAFLGSRCVVVEGVHVSKGAVLGSGVILTASTKIIDVSKSETQTYKSFVPRNAVVIPGSYAKKFPGGEFQVPCALIIGERKESTDLKTSLNNALRDFEVSV